jgi:hypothetical protein
MSPTLNPGCACCHILTRALNLVPMRETPSHPIKQRRQRRAEWNRYATKTPLLDRAHFGATFRLGKSSFRIEGWLQRNHVNSIYVIRSDGKTFAVSPNELPDGLTFS